VLVLAMDDALAQEADAIAKDILQGRDVRPLNPEDMTLAQAYEVQDRVASQIGPLCGRKIAMNAPKLMEMAGVSEPIVGNITGQEALPSGDTMRVSDFAELAVEPEFAAVIGQDVPAGTPVTKETVLEHVARFSMAFEVLDKRKDQAAMSAPRFVANNVFNAGVVLAGEALDIAMLDQGAYDAVFSAAGDILVDGQGTAPQNPLEACAFVLNHFSMRGQTVRAGEVILCGAHHPPLVIERTGAYVFSLSTGAEVSLLISS